MNLPDEKFHLKRRFNSAIRLMAILFVLGASILFFPRLIVTLYARSRTFGLADVPQKRVAVVFGAGIMRDGRLTPQLTDRVATAADLYFAGKVEKLLMSGDNRFVDYNEPAAMRACALRLGVPDDAIVLDYAGRRTYDTCYRARDIFEVRDVILLTQRYHLPRALYTCNALGVDAVGVPADRAVYRHLYGKLREFPATALALWEVHVSHPLPVLGKSEPVFQSSDRLRSKAQVQRTFGPRRHWE
jgi:SanA protein